MEIRLENLPYEYIRWIENEDVDMDQLKRNFRYEEDQGSEGPSIAAFCT